MINIKQGDCLELMKDMKDNNVDMVLCDLPYGTTRNEWDKVIPLDLLWLQYKRVIKDKGAIVLFGNEPFSSQVRLSNPKWYRYDWKWQKSKSSGFLNAKHRPLRNYEDIMM